MDDAERELFARSVAHAMERSAGPELDTALAALGWRDALVADRRAAVSTVFGLQGAARAASSAIDGVLLAALGVDGDAGVVLPALSGRRPPGEPVGGVISVRGLGSAALRASSTAAVVAGTMDDASLFLVPTAALDLQPISGIDPALGLVVVTGEVAPPRPLPVDWPAAVSVGHLALGHELVGSARTMLRHAREHALERVQFDRPIAMFQAVRHRLAETLVAIEAADALLGAAWDDGATTSALMAKAMAGRAARIAGRHCQQVLAGIGFTTEHPFQGYVKRALVLDQMLGSAPALTADLGQALLGAGRLPPLLPL